MSERPRGDVLQEVTAALAEALTALDDGRDAGALRASLKGALRELGSLTQEAALEPAQSAQGTLGLDEEEVQQPEPLELDRLADLQKPLHDVDLDATDGERLTDHLDDLNVLFEVSANALGATTVEDLLQRVVDGARRVTGARLASAGYGYHAGVFEVRATSTPGDQPTGGDRGVLSAEPREIVLELLERRHSIRLSRAELPDDARSSGGLVGARLVGREGATDGHILVFDKAGGEFRAEDEALLSQLAAFTSLGLQHIQARGEAEARFAEAEEGRSILRAIMEHVPEGIAVADGPDATVRMMSRFGQQMVGRDPTEIQSTQLDRKQPLRWRVFHVQDNTLALPEELPLTRAIREGRTVIDEEWLVEDQHGKKSFALFNAGPIKDREGGVTGGVAVWRDITERKRAEAELIAARERLIRQEKLAYLGALAGGVGHELRTPLGSIANAAYFLKLVIDEPSGETEEAISILQREVGTAESIITALLDFARPRPPRREEVELNELLTETLSKLDVPEQVNVVWTLDSTAIASVDRGQLSQVFGNILTNALQAMPDGGQLTIGTHSSTEGITVSISDSGPGIDAAHIGELFEPLFTTKARGIGLGLSVAQTLIRRHGGTIEVETVKGEGTTFHVRLPDVPPGGGVVR